MATKQVKYRLISAFEEKPDDAPADYKPQSTEPYQLLDKLVALHHPHLIPAKIALAWQLDIQADTDGILMLGKCKKASDLDRELRDYDFIVLLNKDAWHSFDDKQRAALLDHELCHAQVVIDPETKNPKKDERGRICYRMRKHDLEEFRAVVERHGCWKSDLQAFAKSLMHRYQTPLFRDQPPEPSTNGAGHKPHARAWRIVTLAEGLRLPETVLTKLAEVDILTIGHLADFSSDGKPLTCIKGIGEATATKIEDALERFWAEHPEYTSTVPAKEEHAHA